MQAAIDAAENTIENYEISRTIGPRVDEVARLLSRESAEAHARLVRAIADRKGALESVTPGRVRAYLAGHGWTLTRALGPPLTHFPLELWACPTCIEAHVLTTTEPADYAEYMGTVARKCAADEGRDIAFVIADWLGAV